MTSHAAIGLKNRSVVEVRGPDWRPFLQNLLTNDVETLPVGEARFTALLTPQGRLLYDLFVMAREDGAWLDVEAAWRDALIQRLTLYRLRAKVEISALDHPVSALLSPQGGEGFWLKDPRLPELGWRGYGIEGQQPETAYDAHRLALGVPGPADWGTDKTYPIEANFDLLGGIDFHKGCFIGQETTSRMHRRGVVKTRMLPIVFDGPAPAFGSEILAGSLRAGEVLSGIEGRAMALVRLDRIEGVMLTVDGRPVMVDMPSYIYPAHPRESGDPVLSS
jgi:folate-binding protein YgfZ